MRMKKKTIRPNRRPAALILCLIVAAGVFFPARAYSQNTVKTVRVGWYESPFNSTGDNGRLSGYAYEYQNKIAAYTGWEYAYVKGSWTDLMEMLVNGEIDLMSDVSYTKERAEKMLFPDLSMGTEEYYIFIAPGNTEITAEDLSTLNGKRVGVNKGSIQSGFFREWIEEHNVNPVVVELNSTEVESLDLLDSGVLDAYITLNAYGDPQRLVPVCKIGSSDFYFAVNKDRPDLLADLNAAMSRIQGEDPYYNDRMFEKHVQRFGSNAFLTAEEQDYLAQHGKIRVGYQDNYMAFCASDPETGELTGALKDYLEAASVCLANARLDFTATPYPTAQSALDALKQGEVDCIFPANFGSYDSERLKIALTPPLMRTDIHAVVKQHDQTIFGNKEHVVVAVNDGNPNYNAFLSDYFPGWTAVYYDTTADCLKAVSDGVADCVLISSYRYNNISRLCKKYHLTTVNTNVGLDYCFAVDDGETVLYSILAKAVGLVPMSSVSAALSRYSAEDAKLTLMDYLADNLPIVITIVAIIVFVILFFLLRALHSEKKAKLLIRATETGNLTGLLNRDYFFQYANRAYRDHPETQRDAIVLNIEQFHSINALNGRKFGDEVLRVLGEEVSLIAAEHAGLAGRFGADRFDIYCRHTDGYQLIFDRLQVKLDGLSPNASIRLRMGVMP